MAEAKREEILRRLGDSCDARAVAVMISGLQEESPKIRLASIKGLGRLGGPESAEALIELLSDPDPQTQLALIPAMLAFSIPRIRGLVLNQIARGNPQETTTPEKAQVTGVAMLTFTDMLDTSYNGKAILFQYDLERSGVPAIQPTVASTLRGLKTTRNGVRELIGILKKHNTPFVRTWAATWLGKLRAGEAKEALQNAVINDKNSEVKAAAEAALRELDRPPVQ
jgi:HEAT repeat protein